MNTIELYCGTKSFSNVASQLGHNTFTVDIEKKFQPDLHADIKSLSVSDFPYKPDVIWCSPPCQAFSVASIGKHWHRDGTPKSFSAIESIALVRHTLRLIRELEPKWFFIENPRGMLRKLPYLNHLPRHTVTYCQYGDTRMKPTDIWTNADWWQSKAPCRNGQPCHEAAPRGSRTGTQGIKGAVDRGRIPSALFEELFEQQLLLASSLAA